MQTAPKLNVGKYAVDEISRIYKGFYIIYKGQKFDFLPQDMLLLVLK